MEVHPNGPTRLSLPAAVQTERNPAFIEMSVELRCSLESSDTATPLRPDHERMEAVLDRLREIADRLDHVDATHAAALIVEANQTVERQIVEHERVDERHVYPRVAKLLRDGYGLGAMSRAHREIIHLARLLRRLADGLSAVDMDRYLIRDAQRIIESIDALVRVHNAQEEDIYEHMNTQSGLRRQ
jgi:hypothetical protein